MDQSVLLGSSLTISCTAEGFPNPIIQWKQSLDEHSEEYREINDGYSDFQILKNGSLIIQNATKKHEGNYLCQASNGIGGGLSKLLKVTVHVGPRVSIKNKQITTRRGDNVSIRCDVDGDLPLDVIWRLRNGQIIQKYSDQRFSIDTRETSNGITSELSILNVNLFDQGEILCMSSNKFGQSSTVTNLQVLEPPHAPKNLNIKEIKSRSVTISWNYENSQPISNYKVQYKDKLDVWNEQNQKIVDGDNHSIQLVNLKPASVYHIRIFAKNDLGESPPSEIL
jgi:Down syndrome cell adhesion molecule